MTKKEGSHLGKTFVSAFLITGVLDFGTYVFGGYEVAIIFAICWLTALIATVAAGIENTIIQNSNRNEEFSKSKISMTSIHNDFRERSEIQ